MVGEWGKKYTGAEAITVGELVNQLGEIAIKTFNASLALGLIGAGPILVHQIHRVHEAEGRKKIFSNLAADMKANKAVQDAPEVVGAAVQHVADKSQASNVYIDGQAFMQTMQANKVSIEDIRQVAPEIADQIETAMRTGGDVVIPTGEYAVKIAPTDIGEALSMHIRTAEDQLSAAEAVQVDRVVRETMNMAINDPARLEQQASEELDDSYKEAAKKVEENYMAQFAKYPKFKKEHAKTQAKFGATVVALTAKRLNVPPTELQQFAPILKMVDAEESQATQAEQGVQEQTQTEQNQTDSQQDLLVREGIVRKPDSATATVVEIPENQVPQFKTVKELKEWIISQFSGVRSAVIKSTNQTVKVTNKGLKDSLKRQREEKHNDIYPVMLSVLENAEYDHFQLNDGQEKHKGIDGQDVYFSAIRIGGKLYSVRFKVDIPNKQEVEDRKALGHENIEDARYKDHTLKEIDLSEVSVHPGSNPADTRQVSVADSATEVSLGVLRGQVKPSRIEDGTLYQKQATNSYSSIDAVRAKYQGTDQWLKAPNGEDTQLTETQWCLVRTPEFKEWFGDWENDPANASKVVDKNGEPLVVYHGGQGRVEDFSRGSKRGHMGLAYFTDDVAAGSSYAFLGGIDGTVETPDDAGHQWTHRSDKNIQAHPHITKAFLNIRNPITPNKIRLKDVVNMFGKELADLEEDNVAFAKFDGDFDAAAEWLSEPSNLQEWLEESLTDEVASNTIENDLLSLVDPDGELQASQGFIALHLLGEIPEYMVAMGYDGFAYADNEAGGTTYVVQSPTQVKSASFNNGQFNPNDSNILRQDVTTPTDPLVTIHNIRETGLLNVNRLGALPVPSLAVTKVGNEYSQYGEISLIGTKGMIDPAQTPVFSADAYTARFPEMNWTNSVDRPKAEALKKRRCASAIATYYRLILSYKFLYGRSSYT